MRSVPLVDLKAGFEPIRDEVMRELGSVFSKMNLHLGPNVQEFEKELASYCGVKYAVGVGSGTEAIQFALLALGVKAGDEIITSTHTFFATVEAIIHAGAKPVFVDIDPLTYNLNHNVINKKITKKTKAMIPVHMYGQSAGMSSIMEISSKHGIPVVEDACQAHGALYNGVKCGSIGAAGCFSFYYTKNLGCYGEGGMVVTNDEKIYEGVRLYRNHGHRSKFEHKVIGYNGRLDEIQAAILRIKLRHLDEYNRKRRERATLYNSLLKDTPVILPVEAEGRIHVYHLYVIRTNQRDGLQKYLEEQGIGTGIHYKNPVHLQEAVSNLGYRKGDFPGAEKVCSEILSIPLYPEIEEDSQIYVADKIKEFLKNR